MLRTVTAAAALAAGALLVSVTADSGAQAQNKKWYPFKVEEHNPPFDMDGPKAEKEYTPLDKASKPWEICVSFPHMKDAYWLAVDYGVADEAKRQGVKMQLVEAGGCYELQQQRFASEDYVQSVAHRISICDILFYGYVITVSAC